MTTLADPGVHPNGSRRGVAPPAMAPGGLIGKAIASTRPAGRRNPLARALGRGWRAFRPAALATAGCGCGVAGTYVAVGLWPALLAAGTSFFLLDWLSRPSPAPQVIVEDPEPGAPDGDGR